MKKFQDGKAARNVKLQLTDGHRIKLLTAAELSELTGVTKSHAYRWIKDPSTLPDRMRDMLEMKALGKIPGFGPGWYFDDNGIQGPRGEAFTEYELDNFGQAMTIVRNYDRDILKLRQQIDWLQQKLQTPPELRKQYSKPKVIQFHEHVKAKEEKQIKEG